MKHTIFCLPLFLLMSFQLFGQAEEGMVNQFIKQDIIKGHIYFLASDALKGRDVGSPEINIAAEYIRTRFQSYGVKTAPGMEGYYQPVLLNKKTPPQKGTFITGADTLSFPDDFLVMQGKNITTSADLMYLTYDELMKAGEEIKGKTVVTNCGDEVSQNPQEWFTISKEKMTHIESKGATGMIELYSSTKIPYMFLKRFLGSRTSFVPVESEDLDDSFLHLWVNAGEENIVKTLKESGTSMQLEIEGMNSEISREKNVVGFVEGTDPKLKDEIIVYSAHYDHVGIGKKDAEGDSIYNGARDNAIGTSTVLEIARNFARFPTKRSAMFILFTGEEKGLLGSKWFVDHSPVPHKDIVYCFNSDNAGYNDTSLATIIGLDRTTAKQHMVKACSTFGLKAIEDPAPEQGLFDRSDNVNFAVVGIPAPTFSLGFTAFDQGIMETYHQPSDNPDSVDYEYLEKFFKSYLLSARYIANDEERPFWVEGDKYYEAGKELYSK